MFGLWTGTACQVYTDPVRSVDGVMRLVTYNVVNYTQHHFGCFSEPEFGAPLEAASYGSVGAPISNNVFWESTDQIYYLTCFM